MNLYFIILILGLFLWLPSIKKKGFIDFSLFAIHKEKTPPPKDEGAIIMIHRSGYLTEEIDILVVYADNTLYSPVLVLDQFRSVSLPILNHF